MDKTEYCDTMEERLRSLDQYLAGLNFPPPATLEAARRQEEKKKTVDGLRARTADALGRVSALRADNAPDWSAARQDLDRRWEEIAQERRSVG